MSTLSGHAYLYVVTAFSFQVVLLIHFILRKWAFDKYVYQYGWIVYALAVPAAIVSVVLMRRGAEWWMWTGGFLYLAWAIFGYVVEYRLGIPWRSPIYWPVYGPYIFLFLSTTMFYWWPLARVGRPFWFAYTVLFVIASILNIRSH
jgi:hypothetical protein